MPNHRNGERQSGQYQSVDLREDRYYTQRPMAIGCSYFGVRIARHAVRDLEDLAARGYTGVLHTCSENDLAHYRGTFERLVAASHDLGLEVQASPWGLGGTFGGEAESAFVAQHPDARQLRADGTPAPAACLNHPGYRDFVRAWANAAVDAGVDYVFWDEPHFATDACSCEHCADRAPGESLIDFLRDMLAGVAARGGRSTVCLLPNEDVGDWDDVAALPGLAILATDPYWKHYGHPAEPFVAGHAARLVEATRSNGVRTQLWLPAFGLLRDDLGDFDDAVAAARRAGVDELWTWGYEACAHMTSLATPDAELVWEHVTRTLTGGGVTEARVAAHADLDLRSTRELVELINEEDGKVPA